MDFTKDYIKEFRNKTQEVIQLIHEIIEQTSQGLKDKTIDEDWKKEIPSILDLIQMNYFSWRSHSGWD